MELSDALKGRRSIRKFKAEPVTDDEIMRLMEAAVYAPSWANTQVSRFYVAKGEKKKELEKSLPDFNKKNVENADVLLASTVVKGKAGFRGDLGAFTHLGDGFQYFDNGLRVENVCLKAYELGLGTLIIGGYYPDVVREYFGIPDTEEVVCLIALGRPDISPQKPKGLSPQDIVTFKK